MLVFRLIAVAAVLVLSGCGTDPAALEKALASDPASVCVSITFAFPPFANTAKACRSNTPGTAVTMDASGNPQVVKAP